MGSAALLDAAGGQSADQPALCKQANQVGGYDAGERGDRHLAEIDQPLALEQRDGNRQRTARLVIAEIKSQQELVVGKYAADQARGSKPGAMMGAITREMMVK